MVRSKAVDVLVWLAVLPVAAWAVVRTAGWTPVWQWVPLPGAGVPRPAAPRRPAVRTAQRPAAARPDA
ncbi:hypothetical protein ACWDR9_15205, partial [Streptosporangium sandarakinum]